MALNMRHFVLCSAIFAAAACSKTKAPEPTLSDKPASAAPAAKAPVATPEAAAGGAGATTELSEISSQTIYFDFDSYSVNASESEKLKKLANALKAANASAVKIQIEGHCDERGSNEYNLALGEKRARAIQDALTAEGVAAGAVSTISYGEERPAAEGHDEAAYSKNRRGEFKKL